MYANALPQRFAPQIAFTDFLATHGVNGIRNVVDSYDTLIANGQSHSQAVNLLNENASRFGITGFDNQLFRDIFNYANSKVGRISGNVKDNPFKNADTNGTQINLETEVRRAHSRGTVTPISSARNYGATREHKEHGYEEPEKVIPITRATDTTNQKPYNAGRTARRRSSSSLRTFGKLAVASGLAAYLTLNPFSGLFGKNSSYVEDAQAQTTQTVAYKPKSVDDYKSVLDKLKQAAAQKGVKDSPKPTQQVSPALSGATVPAGGTTAQAGTGKYTPKSVDDYTKTLDALKQFAAERKQTNDDLLAKLESAEKNLRVPPVKYDDLKSSVADARQYYDANNAKLDPQQKKEAEERLTNLEDAVKKYAAQVRVAVTKPADSKQVKASKASGIKQDGDVWVYNHDTEENKKFRKGEIKYGKMSQDGQDWFSVQRVETRLREDSGKYFIDVKPVFNTTTGDQSVYRAWVRLVHGTVKKDLRIGEYNPIQVTKQDYEAMGNIKNPVESVRRYKPERHNTLGDILRVSASWVFGKKAIVTPPAPAPVPTPPVAAPPVPTPPAPTATQDYTPIIMQHQHLAPPPQMRPAPEPAFIKKGPGFFKRIEKLNKKYPDLRKLHEVIPGHHQAP